MELREIIIMLEQILSKMVLQRGHEKKFYFSRPPEHENVIFINIYNGHCMGGHVQCLFYFQYLLRNLWPPSMIIILRESRLVFLFKLIFKIRFSDALLVTEVIYVMIESQWSAFRSYLYCQQQNHFLLLLVSPFWIMVHSGLRQNFNILSTSGAERCVIHRSAIRRLIRFCCIMSLHLPYGVCA